MSRTDNFTPRRINRVSRESSRRASTRNALRSGNFDTLDTFGPTRRFRTGVEA